MRTITTQEEYYVLKMKDAKLYFKEFTEKNEHTPNGYSTTVDITEAYTDGNDERLLHMLAEYDDTRFKGKFEMIRIQKKTTTKFTEFDASEELANWKAK